MKLLHVLGDSKWGGGSAVVLTLAEATIQAGWQVDVLTTDAPTAAAARAHGLGVVELDVIRRAIRPWSDLAGLLRLAAFLRRARYDLVHTHTSKAGFVGRLAARLARVPAIVHTVHGFAFHEGSTRRELRAYTLLEKIAARCCDRIVTVSRFHRQWALELGIAGPAKIEAIPNGIAAPRVHVSRAALRRRLAASEGDVVILAPGRLAPEKGLEVLLLAISLLPDALRRNLKVLLAGEGELHDRLEENSHRLGLEDQVQLLGFRGDIPQLLQAADMVVLPSFREGLSICLLEAMGAGRPIIASNIGSMKEGTAGGEAAILVPPGDAGALADAIRLLAGDPALAARLGRRAHEVYRQRYTAGVMLAAYSALYAELTRTPAAAGMPVTPQGVSN